MILDNLNHHKSRGVLDWVAANAVELCFTPTYASWANPISSVTSGDPPLCVDELHLPEPPSLGRPLARNARDPELRKVLRGAQRKLRR
ncbi:MAG: transposase [Actinomycetota bacterium]